jgi:hypothetical protein
LNLVDAIKWTATAILVAGSVMNGMNMYPWAQLVLVSGGIFWFVAACITRDWPLMVTNGIMNLAVIAGLLYNFL